MTDLMHLVINPLLEVFSMTNLNELINCWVSSLAFDVSSNRTDIASMTSLSSSNTERSCYPQAYANISTTSPSLFSELIINS